MEKEKLEEYVNSFLSQSYMAAEYKLESDGLSEKEIEEILSRLKEKFLSNQKNNKILTSNNISNVNTPKHMTVGVEIETFVKNKDTTNPSTSEDFEEINSLFKNDMLEIVMYLGWKPGTDESIRWIVDGKEVSNGVEIKSPILNSGDYNIGREVNNICKLAILSNCDVNETCSIHIHVGSNYLENAQAYINLLEIWCNNEDLLYLICNPPKELIRESAIREIDPQADCWSQIIKSAMENNSLNINKDDSLEAIKEKLINFQSLNPTKSQMIDSTGKSPAKRQRGLNFMSLEKFGTIEFRVHNGSIDGKTISEDINLDTGLLVFSQSLSLIQEKSTEELTQEEKEKLREFEKITSRKNEMSQEERLVLLLNLIIPEGQNKDVYIERYLANLEILKNNPEMSELFQKKISTVPIKLQPVYSEKFKDVNSIKILNDAHNSDEKSDKIIGEEDFNKAYTSVRKKDQTAKIIFANMIKYISKKLHFNKQLYESPHQKIEETEKE